jgi:hypothetical protein
MKRFAITLIAALVICGVSPLRAQFSEATITFDNMNHNFGNIKEEGGVVEHDFVFKNTGTEPLLLTNVRSSCGCTVPEWSKEPIAPGESGSVKVTFNPLRRPGAFRKSITVQSNAKQSTVVLYIVGMVEPKPKTIADEYPIEMGPIRLSTNHLSVARIKNNETKTASINVLNGSDRSVTITIPDSPEHITFHVNPETLLPNQKGTISMDFDASRVNDWGFVSSRVYVYFNGEKFTGNLLAASGSIEEDFSGLTAEQMANSPKMTIGEETFNFGNIEQGEVIEHDFSFKNEGKETLLIRKIRTTCGCTASSPSSTEIGPGEDGTIHVTFNSRAKKGKQLQTVTVITNDPNNSTHYLRMAGTVEVPEK